MRRAIPVLVVLLLLAAGVQVSRLRASLDLDATRPAEIAKLRERLRTMPLSLSQGAYQGRWEPVPDWIVERSGADAHASVIYTDAAGMEYKLYVGGAARSGGAFHRPDVCMPSAGWTLAEDGTAPLRAFEASSATPTMRRMVAQHGTARMLVYYWFQTGREVATSELRSSYHRFLRFLRMGRPASSYIVSVYVTHGADDVSADDRAERFLRAIGPQLCELLEGEE